MKTHSLQSKLFSAYLGMACLILFSFAVFFYIFTSNQLKESQLSAMTTLNSTFQTQTDSAIRNLDTVSVNINYSSISKTILNQTFDLNISDKMLSDMSNLFISLSGTELKADQVNLYDFSGYVLQSGLSTMVKKTMLHRTNGLKQLKTLTEKSSHRTLQYLCLYKIKPLSSVVHLPLPFLHQPVRPWCRCDRDSETM